MSITIQEPCQENWGDMTPSQKGAFCKTCAIDVVDFSNKSSSEIRETLKASLGQSMCGRFEKKQLHNLNQEFEIWKNQSAKTFQSKFLWACLIAFGMTLFSACGTSTAQELDTNYIETTLLLETPKDSLKSDSTITQLDSIATEPDYTDFIMGDIAYDPSWDEEIIEPDASDTVTSCTELETKDNFTNEEPIPHEPRMVKGRFVVPEYIEEPAEEVTDSLKKPEAKNVVETIVTPALKAFVFPNPTNDQSTLKIKIDSKTHYKIDLYSIDGKLVTNIYNGLLDKSEVSFPIDLSKNNPGTYLISITSNTINQSLKINKVD